ncbi:hypothetical protein HYU95_04760 [Candidatus Daviesbacteria bacterium]|nr:hypothetical protein [Candidatus Daviesbacteria bacterium]
MENNNLPNTTIPNPVPPQAGGGTKESNKLIIWFVLGLVVIAVLVGGIYMFLSTQQAAIPKPQAIVSQTPTPVVQEDLEGNLDGIDVGDEIESDISALDRDLQQL